MTGSTLLFNSGLKNRYVSTKKALGKYLRSRSIWFVIFKHVFSCIFYETGWNILIQNGFFLNSTFSFLGHPKY